MLPAVLQRLQTHGTAQNGLSMKPSVKFDSKLSIQCDTRCADDSPWQNLRYDWTSQDVARLVTIREPLPSAGRRACDFARRQPVAVLLSITEPGIRIRPTFAATQCHTFSLASCRSSQGAAASCSLPRNEFLESTTWLLLRRPGRRLAVLQEILEMRGISQRTLSTRRTPFPDL